MAQAGQLILVRTNPATQFRGAVAQNGVATESLTPGSGPGFFDDGLAASRSARARLRSLTLISAENLDWEVWLWGTDQFATPTLLSGDLAPLARVVLLAANAVQIAGAGSFYSFAHGIDLPYVDLDQTSELHLGLGTRSGAGKSAGDAGAVQIQLHFEPTLGW